MKIILAARKFKNIDGIWNVDYLVKSKFITMDLSEIFISIQNDLGAAWL